MPPQISVSPSVLVVRAGESPSLTCLAEAGSPTPSLTWRRKTKHGDTELTHLVTQEAGETEAVLQLDKVTRHEAGQYECSADNGQARPVSESVRLQVEFSPEISVEHHVVQARWGEEVQLTCIVHAFPHAEVSWKKVGRTEG